MEPIKSYSHDQMELIEQFVQNGFPKEFGEVVARQLHSEKALYRMTQYMRSAVPSTMEEVADELLSLLTEVENWKEKKVNEYYNSKLNELLWYGLEDENNDEKEI